MRADRTLAAAGACVTLFGVSFLASFLTADVMGKDEKASAPVAPVQKPRPQVVEAPEGRALSLTEASGLPALRRPPKPPKPAPAPPPAPDLTDESTVEEPAPEPAEPAPVEVPVEPTPTYTPPPPDPVPAPPPPPPPDPPPTTEFWGSG